LCHIIVLVTRPARRRIGAPVRRPASSATSASGGRGDAEQCVDTWRRYEIAERGAGQVNPSGSSNPGAWLSLITRARRRIQIGGNSVLAIVLDQSDDTAIFHCNRQAYVVEALRAGCSPSRKPAQHVLRLPQRRSWARELASGVILEPRRTPRLGGIRCASSSYSFG
jgi:hypothetical protein